MKNNERVKLVADLLEAAEKNNCKLPDSVLLDTLNDKHNMGVLKVPNKQKDMTPTKKFAKDLISKRKKAKKAYEDLC